MARRNPFLKVVVLGDSAVGKTSLLNRFVRNMFELKFKPSIGADFFTNEIDVDGKKVNLQIWDTAGQERFQSLGTAFYRGTDGCILVYDVEVEQTFTNLKKWKEVFLIQSGIGSETEIEFPFLVLGNKIDLGNRVVTDKTAKKWCQENGNMPYMETSAKEAINVEAAFTQLARKIIVSQKESVTDTDMLYPEVKTTSQSSCPC